MLKHLKPVRLLISPDGSVCKLRKHIHTSGCPGFTFHWALFCLTSHAWVFIIQGYMGPLCPLQQCIQPLVNPKHVRSSPLWLSDLLELPVKSLAHLLVCYLPHSDLLTQAYRATDHFCLLATEITTVTDSAPDQVIPLWQRWQSCWFAQPALLWLNCCTDKARDSCGAAPGKTHTVPAFKFQSANKTVAFDSFVQLYSCWGRVCPPPHSWGSPKSLYILKQ